MSRRLWRIAAIGLTGLVLAACLLPAQDLPDVPGGHLDKLQHVLAFALLGLCWHRSGIGLPATLLVGLLLVGLTEGGQAVLGQGRTAELLDALADLGGLLLGTLASLWLPRRRAVPVSER